MTRSTLAARSRTDEAPADSTSIAPSAANDSNPFRVLLGRGRRVLQHGHIPAFSGQRSRDRNTGLGESDDECAAHGVAGHPRFTPWRRKSA